MARVKIRDVILNSQGQPISGATVLVCEPGTSTPTVAGTPVAATLYADRTGGTTKSNPLTTDSAGEAIAWMDAYQLVDLYETALGAARNLPYLSPEADLGDYTSEVNGTLSSPTINNPTIDGGTWEDPTLINAALNTATLTAPVLDDPTITGDTIIDSTVTAHATPSGSLEHGVWIIKSDGSDSSGAATWGARDALVEIRDMNETSIDSSALLIRYVENTTGSPKARSGIHVNGWTRPDAGESSCLICVQTGAGGCIVGYHAAAMRPPGYPDLGYQTGSVIEVSAQDMGPAIYAASGASFPVSHSENAYTTISSGILIGTAMVGAGTIPVTELSKIPDPGAAGIYSPGTWPTPLYVKIDAEYFSYTGRSASSGAGNLTGVTRAINTAAAAHSSGASVETARPNHALNVALARPISKGIVIEPVDGNFDTRPALAVGTRAIGALADTTIKFIVAMNGNFTSVGTGQVVNFTVTGDQTVGGTLGVTGVATLGTANATLVDTARLEVDHIVGEGTAPSIAAGAGAGTGPTVSVTGSDTAGSISVITGTTPSASAVVATVTFGTAFASAPRSVILTPADGNAAALSGAARPWVDLANPDISTSMFRFRVAATNLVASTTYRFYYMVMG